MLFLDGRQKKVQQNDKQRREKVSVCMTWCRKKAIIGVDCFLRDWFVLLTC